MYVQVLPHAKLYLAPDMTAYKQGPLEKPILMEYPQPPSFSDTLDTSLPQGCISMCRNNTFSVNVVYEWKHNSSLLYTISSGDPPSMPELLRLQIPEEVGDRYYKFGIFLLHDKTGGRVNIIKKDCRGDSEQITQKILQKWIAGNGLPVTWESLIQTLRDTGLPVLAEQIKAGY